MCRHWNYINQNERVGYTNTMHKQDKNHEPKVRHVFIHAAILLVILLAGIFGYTAYKDWDNARFMRGIVSDFSGLVKDIESQLNIELNIQANCFTTSEKSGSGVGVCDIGAGAPESLPVDIYMIADSNFERHDEFENQQGYLYNYMNKTSCEFSNERSLYLSCVVAPREANADLARELFIETNYN